MIPVVIASFHAPTGTWSYVAVDPATRRTALIDPVLDFDPASGRTGTMSAQALLDRALAQGGTVDWILETHAHADHLSAADWLRKQLPQARLGIGAGIRQVQRHFARVLGLSADEQHGAQFDRLFDDDERFALGGIEVRVLAVPGHTSDSVAYLVGDALFCGDTLFMPDGGTARCDFPGGDAARLYRSIRRMLSLPDDTRIFVCHDYAPGGREVRCETTVAQQRRDNVHVHDGIDEAQYVQMRQARDATLPVPALLWPSLQVNLRAGALPAADDNGIRYLRIPLDAL